MKFKTSAIALAVAGTVAAPVAVQAGADELYVSARVGLWNQDTADASNWAVRSFSSRLGARGETDLGNGMMGYGQIEWDIDFNADTDGGATSTSPGEDDIGLRQRWVGLKGDFGSLQIGQGWWTFYSFAVAPNDNPWWHSGYTMVDYRGRTDNAITYTGGSDGVSFGASLYFDDDADEEDIDATEFGVSFGIGDMSLGIAVASTETTQGSFGTDDDILGLALSGIAVGDVSLGFGLQTQDDDSSFLAHIGAGNLYIHIEMLMADAASGASISGDDEDKVGITLGYTQSLGRKTTMYYEFFNKDEDSGDSDDDKTHIMAVLKYDII